MSADLRRHIAAEARTWLGTPYHHHARVKGVGVDCAQLLAAVFEVAGVIPHLDLGNYATQWHLHHGDELFLQWLQRCGARPLAEGEAPQLGDIGVWRYGRTHSHGGIVVEAGPDPLIVHAYIRRKVITTRVSEAPLAGAPVCYWSTC